MVGDTHFPALCELPFPFQWFFFQPWVIPLHACTNQYSADDLQSSICETLSSLDSILQILVAFGLPEFPTLITSIQGDHWSVFGSPSYAVASCTPLFPFSKGSLLMLLVVQCLKTFFFIIVYGALFFGCSGRSINPVSVTTSWLEVMVEVPSL